TPFAHEVPLSAAAALFGELLELGDRDDLRLVRARIDARVRALFAGVERAKVEDHVHAVGSLFDLRYPDSRFDELTGDARRRRLFEALTAVVNQAARERPLVVAIDDAHFADPLSLEFAAHYF